MAETDSKHEESGKSAGQKDALTSVDSPSANEPTPSAARARLPKWARALGWGLFGVMSTTVLTVGVFTAVPALQHKVIMLGVGAVDGLKINKIEGHLLHPTLTGIRYEAPGISVEIHELKWAIDWRELPARHLRLPLLAAEGVRVKVDTSALPKSEEKKEEPLGRIELPIAVTLENTSLSALEADIDTEHLSLGALHLALQAKKSTLTLERLTLDKLAVSETQRSNAAPSAAPQPTAAAQSATHESDAHPIENHGPAQESSASGADTAANSAAKRPALKAENPLVALEKTLAEPLLSEKHLPSLAALPVDVDLKSVELKEISFATPALQLPTLEHLTLIASVRDTGVKLPHLAAALDDGTRLLASGRWEAKEMHPVAASFWVKPGEALKKALPTPIEPLSSLSSLTLDVKGALLTEVQATLAGAGAHPFDAKLTARPAVAGNPVTLEAQLSHIDAGATLPAADALTLAFAADFSAQGLAKGAATQATADEATATTGASPAAVPRANASQESTPTSKTAPASAPRNFTLALKGTVVPAPLEGIPAIKPLTLNVEADGTLSHLSIRNTGLQNKEMTAVLEGELDWREKLAGEVNLALVRFHVGALAPAVPVRLGGEAMLSFSSESADIANSWSAELKRARFTGELLNGATPSEKAPSKQGSTKAARTQAEPTKARGKARASTQVASASAAQAGGINRVELDAEARVNAKLEWSAKVKSLRWGENSATLDGRGTVNNGVLATHSVAQLALDKLSDFSPTLHGALSGQLTVDGAFGSAHLAPIISAELSGDDLSLHAADGALIASLGALDLHGTFGKKGGEPLTLTLSKLLVGESDEEASPMKLSEVKLTLAGTLPSHRVTLDAMDGPLPLSIALTGGLNSALTAWRGSLERAKLTTPIGPWEAGNVALSANLSEGSARIAPHCWRNTFSAKATPNEVCLAQEAVVGNAGSAKLALKHFDVAALSSVMPRDLSLSGVFTGGANLAWNAADHGALPKLTAELNNAGLTLTNATDNGPVAIKFERIALEAKTEKEALAAKLIVTPEHNGALALDVGLSNLSSKSPKLLGHIQLDKWTLDALNQLFDTGEVVHGTLAADVKLGGTLAAPELTGQVHLHDADVKNGLVPIAIEPSDIVLTFEGRRSTLAGNIRTTEGELAINGEADWTDMAAPSAEVRLRTRRDGRDETMGLTLPPYAELNVGADVTARATNSGLDVSGEVVIPRGTITIKELPDSAVQASSDLVMLKRDLTPMAPKGSSFPIRSSLKITIGPRVRVDAFNLKARLSGELSLKQSNQGLGLNGSIKLNNGNFYAYGQALNITKGEILFSGPVDNPYLNLEAVRDANATEDSVTAGLRVTGAASAPKVTIFSTPAMSQEEALSYLLRGQGLGSSSSDGQAVATALLGMGLSQTSSIVGSIGSAFGIRDLQVTSEGVGVKTKVVVKGNLLPRLQLKYGVGVFDSLATFTLRYRLLPRLYLQGVWGENQTLDLLYRWEFN